MYGADVVSIAATSSGVTDTITVPSGAHLRNISLSCTQVNTGAVITILELSWPQSPNPLKFVPNAWAAVIGTSVTGGQVSMMQDEKNRLPLDVIVVNATLVTIKVTTTANLTVKIGLEWD